MDSKTLKYYADYRAKNREKVRAYNREYNKKYRKENGYANERKWDAENPDKRRAHAMVATLVKSGKLKKQGKGEVYHHADYDKPKSVKLVSKSTNRKLAK